MDLTHFEGFKNFMNSKNLPDVYAIVLFSQAIFETGRFTSNIYQQAKNMYGMRPNSRKLYVSILNTATGEYCVYADAQTSILDRVALDAQNGIAPVNNINDIQAYMREVLDAGYATDPNYFEKWFTIVRQTLDENRTFITNVPNDELEDLLNDDGSSSSPFGSKIIFWIIGLVLGFYLVKRWKKRR